MSEAEPPRNPATPTPDERCNEALKFQVAGRLDLAAPIYRSILADHPAHGAANHCLGMLLVQSLRTADGLTHLLAALDSNPEVAEYWLGFLEALLLLGETARAADALALARRHGLSGNHVDEFTRRLSAATAATAEIGRVEARRLETALIALVGEQRFKEALPLARELTQRFPEHGLGWKILAAMLWASTTPEDALPAMRESVRLLPDDAEARSNLGSALNKLQRLDEAEEYLQQALKIDPDFAAAHANLGANYQMQGCCTEAESHLRRAATLGADVNSNLLFTLNHNPDIDADTLAAAHFRAGARLESGLDAGRTGHMNDRRPERCLQVGFVSGDLRSHAIASFVEPLFECWRNVPLLNVSVYYNHPAEDDVSARLRRRVARWRGINGMPDATVAQAIEADRIDILVDLSGHTAMHRLGTFALKPAPVQVSWLGYPATTGLRAMDYYLADRGFLPPGEFERLYTEKLAHVPAVWPFQPYDSAPPVSRLPALDAGYLSFGSFNRIGKINHATIRLWSRLLRALPASTLMLAGVPLGRQHRRLLDWFVAEGIARERLTVHPWTNLDDLLALHAQVDIALEPTPYTGCTTSNHALWMGVPTLTLVGPTPASRLSAANLGHLGLVEFIAATPDAFVDKARRWSANLRALSDLRAGLRARWQASPARNPVVVAAGIERALRHMWHRWCAGLPPASFEITAADLE